MIMTRTLVAFVVSAFLGCSGQVDAPASAWKGHVVEEGSITSVYNESGSIWATSARLVDVDGGFDIVLIYDASGVAFEPLVLTFEGFQVGVPYGPSQYFALT